MKTKQQEVKQWVEDIFNLASNDDNELVKICTPCHGKGIIRGYSNVFTCWVCNGEGFLKKK